MKEVEIGNSILDPEITTELTKVRRRSTEARLDGDIDLNK